MPCIFDSISALALRSASFTAARIRSDEQLRVVRVDRLRVDLDRDDLAAAGRLHRDHAAAGGGLDDLVRRLLLYLLHLGLHLLGLLHQLVHVELAHRGSSTSWASNVSLNIEMRASSLSCSSSSGSGSTSSPSDSVTPSRWPVTS